MNTEIQPEIEVKENDVFSFRYSEEYMKEHSYSYHCFDGTLVGKKFTDGSIKLVDTYWSGSSESRNFDVEKAMKEGHLTFKFNLNDVDEVRKSDEEYYDADDFMHMYIHAGYRNRYFIKKGAVRSQSTMINSIKEKIAQAIREKESAERQIKRYEETLAKIELGDTTVYL